jgi:hypothetical protein
MKDMSTNPAAPAPLGAPARSDLMPPGTCPLLRTKTMALNTDYRRPGQASDDWAVSSTAIFWCVTTMSVMGPDDLDAHPEDCCKTRACYGGRDVIDV